MLPLPLVFGYLLNTKLILITHLEVTNMILLCPYSGQYWSASALTGVASTRAHPIFSLTYQSLRAIYYGLYIEPSDTPMSDNDIRLLALALLNSSGLITWDTPAIPSYDIAIAHNSLPELVSNLDFMLDTDRGNSQQLSATFASLRINADNNDMTIIPVICAEWRRNSSEYFGELAETRRRENNRQALESLTRLLATSYKNPSRYIVHLSRWVIASLAIPAHEQIIVTKLDSYTEYLIPLADYYSYILCYSGNVEHGGYQYSITEEAINSLLDLMLDKLDYSNQFCFTASGLLRQLLATGYYHNARGFQAGYLRSSAIAEYLETPELPEPIRADYPDFKSYFLAKAKWTSQQSALTALANIPNQSFIEA